MKHIPTLLASLSLAAAACGRAPAELPAPQPAPLAEGSPGRALCLAAVQGDGPVDALLRERQAAVQHMPQKMDAWILVGRAWVEKARNGGDPGFYLHADGCAQEVLAHEPGNVLALGLRSLALMNDHKFVDAKALAEQMIAKDSDDLTAWGTLSDANLELGDIDGAERALQEMMDRKPNLPSYARASFLKFVRGDEKGALEAIRLAYDAGRGQRDPEPSAWVLSEAANLFWMRGDVEGARAGYEMALREKADHAPALVGKARCLIAQNQAKDAVPLLQQAYATTPLVETAWWMARAQTVLGDSAAAEQWITKAIDAGKQGDHRSLALLLATVNRDIPAAQKAIAADNAHRGGPWADDVAALVAWRAGDMKTALDASARAVSFGTPDPRLWLHRGVILVASGDAHGKKLIDDALAHGMRFDPAASALAQEVMQ